MKHDPTLSKTVTAVARACWNRWCKDGWCDRDEGTCQICRGTGIVQAPYHLEQDLR